MGNFEKVAVTKKIVSTKIDSDVEIVKYRKVGTNRTFWTPEFEGLRISKTMFSQLSQATKVGKSFMLFKEKENLTDTFVKSVLQELHDEYIRDVHVPCGTESFDEYVWQRLSELGEETFNAIAKIYGDMDEAISKVM